MGGTKQDLSMSTSVKSAKRDKKNKKVTGKEVLKEQVLGQEPTSGSTNTFDALNGEVDDEVDG